MGCAGPYSDLEASFKSDKNVVAQRISSKSMFLASTSKRSANYQGTVSIKLSPDWIEIEQDHPLGFFSHRLLIPKGAVLACSKTCFGDTNWEANLLIVRTGTQISVPNGGELMEWCWNNRIPMVSGNDRRQWLYNNKVLSVGQKYPEQFASREKYEMQKKMSCLGY